MVLLFVDGGASGVVGVAVVVVEVRAVLRHPIHVQGKVPRRLIL